MLKKLPDHFIGTGATGSATVRKPGRGRTRETEFLCHAANESIAAIEAGDESPQRLGEKNGRVYWWYADAIYGTDERDLAPDEVHALLDEQDNKKRVRIQKARDLQAMAQQLDVKGQRQAIAGDVKTYVWRRDQGQCTTCGSNRNLEFDHIIPLAMGGSNTASSFARLGEAANEKPHSSQNFAPSLFSCPQLAQTSTARD